MLTFTVAVPHSPNVPCKIVLLYVGHIDHLVIRDCLLSIDVAIIGTKAKLFWFFITAHASIEAVIAAKKLQWLKVLGRQH